MQVKNLLLLGVIASHFDDAVDAHAAMIVKTLVRLLRDDRVSTDYRGSAADLLSSILPMLMPKEIGQVTHILLGLSGFVHCSFEYMRH